MPTCVFSNVKLWNRYLQTMEYVDRQTSLNRAQMKSLPNKEARTGPFKVLLSPTPPSGDLAGADWLDTQGRLGGTVFWRFILPEGTVSNISATIVDLP